MKNLLGIVIYYFFSISLLAQTTYYISSSEGSDSNPGTSQNSPWETISKLNNTSFLPGDRILFKSGDKWGGAGLLIKNSGTSNSMILFGSYGSGSKPVLSLVSEVAGWNISSNWIKVNGDSIWKMTFPNYGYQATTTSKISRLWLDEKEYPKAKDLNSSNLDQLTPGEPETFGVNRKHRHYHEGSNPNQLYVWTNGNNPASFYHNMEYAGNYSSAGMERFTIQLKDADYITLENLNITGGLYSPISLNGSDNIIIKNCYIGKSQHAGVAGDMQLGSDKTSDNVEISNCTIDTERKVKLNFYDGLVEYGIAAESGLNWKIHDNSFKNWNFGFLTVSKYGICKFFEFYNNDVTAPDIEACKPMQLGSMGDNFQNGMHKIYNNYFHNIPIGVQIGSGAGSGSTGGKSNGNKFYFNVFKDFTFSENEHFSASNSGYGFSIISNSDSTYIFNNTFYTLRNSAVIDWSANRTFAFNNLIINAGTSRSVHINQYNKFNYQNNHLSCSSLNSSSKIFYITDGSSYDVAGFNNLNGSNGRVVTGNEWCGSYTIKTINNITIPVINPTAHKGIDISSLIPSEFKDRNGNIVNRTTPFLGAFQNSSSTAQIQLNAKIFLQAPYNSGEMSTSLNTSQKISLSQPYNCAPWNYAGTENILEIPEGVVDWILLEIRNDTSAGSAISTRAAFLKSDGTITDLDGINPVYFSGVDEGDYYIVVKHRNHLAVMSADKVNLSASYSISYNFTTSPSKAFGNELVDLGNGNFGMYAGDGDANGIINVLDYGTVGNNLFEVNYQLGDIDLNGIINVLDFKNTNHNLLKSSRVPGTISF